MKSNILKFDVVKEEITLENVLEMSEVIVFAQTRFLIGYMGTRMQKLYAEVCADIKHKKDIRRVFSDGYDLVQEGALYLCEHYGRRLNDVIGYTKKGKAVTIRIACIKKMMKLINRKTSDYYRSISTEELKPAAEPSMEIKEEAKRDYAVCDKIVESLKLTDNMRVALECRMSGLSYPEIGRILDRAQSTVFEYFIKMRQRYTVIYG